MDVKEQIQLREDLMMKPYVPKSSLAKPSLFPAYRESKKEILYTKILWNRKLWETRRREVR